MRKNIRNGADETIDTGTVKVNKIKSANHGSRKKSGPGLMKNDKRTQNINHTEGLA